MGRLDADTEGLLLLTNDGELGHRLMHPSYEVAKTYLAEVPAPSPGTSAGGCGPVSSWTTARRRSTRSARGQPPGRAVVEVVLHEGRKHIVRRLLDAVGHPVERLVRTAIGEVQLGDQRPGKVRQLTGPEIAQLYRAVGLCRGGRRRGGSWASSRWTARRARASRPSRGGSPATAAPPTSTPARCTGP